VGNTATVQVDHYEWFWDDGTATYTTTAPQTTHTFSSPGAKTIRVDVIGLGGKKIGTAQITMTVL
jgi:PKD repeat protein